MKNSIPSTKMIALSTIKIILNIEYFSGFSTGYPAVVEVEFNVSENAVVDVDVMLTVRIFCRMVRTHSGILCHR